MSVNKENVRVYLANILGSLGRPMQKLPVISCNSRDLWCSSRLKIGAGNWRQRGDYRAFLQKGWLRWIA